MLLNIILLQCCIHLDIQMLELPWGMKPGTWKEEQGHGGATGSAFCLAGGCPPGLRKFMTSAAVFRAQERESPGEALEKWQLPSKGRTEEFQKHSFALCLVLSKIADLCIDPENGSAAHQSTKVEPGPAWWHSQ